MRRYSVSVVSDIIKSRGLCALIKRTCSSFGGIKPSTSLGNKELTPISREGDIQASIPLESSTRSANPSVAYLAHLDKLRNNELRVSPFGSEQERQDYTFKAAAKFWGIVRGI